jgi:uncharacterized glyoxalase superfamily protein PhnB
MSNIETLKQQAKQYRRWHVNGTIPSQPKSGPRYPDFAMSGTRRYWKSGADAMTDEPRQTPPRPILSSIEAQLFVANIKSSCDFYTNKLGFGVEFIYGDPPFYGQVVRDNARLNLKVVLEPVFVADVRRREHLLSASITVATANEIKQLFLSYQAAGVSFPQTLKKEPWGARTFIVSDPDENLILFAGPAAD